MSGNRSRSRSRERPANAFPGRPILWHLDNENNYVTKVTIKADEMRHLIESLQNPNGEQFLRHLTNDNNFVNVMSQPGWKSALRIYITYESPRFAYGKTKFKNIKLTDKIKDAKRDILGITLEDVAIDDDEYTMEGSFNIYVYYHLHTKAGDDCIICLDPIEKGTGQYLQCGHGFHKVCIEEHRRINDQCPICRRYSQIDTSRSGTFQRRRRRTSRKQSKKCKRSRKRSKI